MTRTTEIAAGAAYVRQSANPADSHPYQVRRNLPDQTYVVVGRYVSAAAAYAAADAANRDAAVDPGVLACGCYAGACRHVSAGNLA